MHRRNGRRLAAAAAEKAQQQYRQDGPDRAQGHQAEAVRLSLPVTSHMGDTNAQGKDERHRHGPRGHTAGVKGNTQKIPVRKGCQGKHGYVAPDQHPPQVDTVENAQHAHHHEKSHAGAHRH